MLGYKCPVSLSEKVLIRTVGRCFDARFALWDLENAVTKKVAVLIFGFFLTTTLETGRILAGSNPSARCPNKNGPLSRTVIKQMVGDEGFEPPALCV